MKIVPDRDRYRRWYLDEDVIIVLDNGDELHIEAGYRFNAHSVPIPFNLLFKRYDTQDIIAALAHDFLLDTAPWHRYSRRCIDNVYKELMHRHARPFRRFWMPFAVTCYGYLFHYWRDNKPTHRKYRTVVRVHVEHMV